MSLFRRRRTPAEADPVEVAETEPESDPTRDKGPWDASEVEETGNRVDLGALWVPKRPGMTLQLEADKKTGRPVAVNIVLGPSALRVQAFAAPRTEGIWDSIREEIATSAERSGGTVEEIPGPFGRELLARLPARTAGGRTGHRPVRFLGVDGPRWFVRGVVSGEAAVDEAQAVALESVFADIVVARGPEARPPRDLLPLHVPGAAPAPAGSDDLSSLDPFTRGPEITEVR